MSFPAQDAMHTPKRVCRPTRVSVTAPRSVSRRIPVIAGSPTPSVLRMAKNRLETPDKIHDRSAPRLARSAVTKKRRPSLCQENSSPGLQLLAHVGRLGPQPMAESQPTATTTPIMQGRHKRTLSMDERVEMDAAVTPSMVRAPASPSTRAPMSPSVSVVQQPVFSQQQIMAQQQQYAQLTHQAAQQRWQHAMMLQQQYQTQQQMQMGWMSPMQQQLWMQQQQMCYQQPASPKRRAVGHQHPGDMRRHVLHAQTARRAEQKQEPDELVEALNAVRASMPTTPAKVATPKRKKTNHRRITRSVAKKLKEKMKQNKKASRVAVKVMDASGADVLDLLASMEHGSWDGEEDKNMAVLEEFVNDFYSSVESPAKSTPVKGLTPGRITTNKENKSRRRKSGKGGVFRKALRRAFGKT